MARRSPQRWFVSGDLRIVLCDFVFIGLLLRFVTLPVTNSKGKKYLSGWRRYRFGDLDL